MMRAEPPVLIVSTKIDVATDAVVLELRRRGVPLVRFNTDDYPFEQGLTVAFDPMSARIVVGEDAIEPRSVWYRRVRGPERPDDFDAGVHEYILRECQTAIHGLAMIAPGRIMSPPAAVFAAENKVHQLSAARAVGLPFPPSCISNEPDAVRAFAAEHGQLICKPLRSGWFRDQSGEWSIYTTALTDEHLTHLDEVRSCPSIFQPLVPKACDVRATFVGDQVFVAEIDSQDDPAARVDWRHTQDPDLPHRRSELPAPLLDRLRLFLRRLNLSFGAVDLIRTPDGEYVFLEVNPSGQWLWLDRQLDLGITAAVAAWLAHGADE